MLSATLHAGERLASVRVDSWLPALLLQALPSPFLPCTRPCMLVRRHLMDIMSMLEVLMEVVRAMRVVRDRAAADAGVDSSGGVSAEATTRRSIRSRRRHMGRAKREA